MVSSNVSNQCSLNPLAPVDSLCFSSNSPPPKDPSEDSGGEESDSHCSFLAAPALVPSSDGSLQEAVCSSLNSSIFSPVPFSPGSVSPTLPFDGPECAIVGLELLGCSRSAALGKPSILKSYKKHWGSFQKWCFAKGLHSLSIDSFLIVDFLRDGSHRLSPSTLSSQWAAINALNICGIFLKFSPLLSRLLNNYRYKKPLVSALVSSWDLSIVLKGLQLAS